jgi:glycosyltransferase involved in cell wall biosynthesis
MGSPRVLQVVLSLNPGGTERLVVELAGRLNADMPMMVCCLDEAGAWAAEVEMKNVQVLALRRAPGFRPSLGHAIARAASRHGATVIHAHHYSPFVYSCLARMWKPELQLVFTEHGRISDTPPSAKRRVANQILGRLPRRVFAVSEHLKNHLVAEGFAPDSVAVVYNGIDIGPLPDAAMRTRIREQLLLADNDVLIGTIGRLEPVKDIETLIKAVAQLAAKMRSMLIIVGDGPERARLEEIVREVPEKLNVRFMGHRNDARQWLAGCDIYVNSSISEGVSLTILEAMAAGLPIIATRVGGTPEVVDESCGRLIPSRDPSALADALLTLARDAELRCKLGRLARRRAESRFTVQRMIDQYREVYASSNHAGH